VTATTSCTALTHAATLREAAYQIRDDALIATRAVRPFLNAVAAWLDASGAELAEAHRAHGKCDEPGGMQAALTIAHAYLEEQS
jgi:hypothetical protein